MSKHPLFENRYTGEYMIDSRQQVFEAICFILHHAIPDVEIDHETLDKLTSLQLAFELGVLEALRETASKAEDKFTDRCWAFCKEN